VPSSAHPHASWRVSRAILIAVVGLLALTMMSMVRTTQAAPADAGFKDHSYGTGVGAPTEDKPQSKVWFADGFWWAGMFVDGTDDYRIHKYNATNHTWAATSTIVDERNSSHGDYLWDGTSLYVASVNGDSDADPILVFKFTYNPSTDTYTLDPDFRSDHDGNLDLENGLVVGQGPSESVTIAKDSTGQLWVTFTNPVDATNRKVMVNRSTTSESVWGTPFQVGDNVGPDDISAIIAYGGNAVGLMMSEHRDLDTTSAFHFFAHPDASADTAWAEGNSISGSSGFAEDHINLKLTATSGGQVLAALKTNDGPNHIQLYSRATNGVWSQHVVVGSGQDVTRPQVVVDESNAMAYVLYTSPELTATGDQAVYYKSAPLSTLNFNPAGLGTKLIGDAGVDINDVSTAKRGVTTASGLMAIASSDTNNSYYHGFLTLGGGSSGPFTDIAGSTFEDDILWLWEEGIASGCTSTTFCPNSPVTRGQMATFLDRALDLDSTSLDYFTDDNGSTHENAINRVRAAGIAFGCTATTYCPNSPVTREQMASFLDRAFDLPSTSTDFFTDDETSTHENAINRVAAAGIASGCTATRYCPKSAVTRGQMAAFLHRALT
jgi:S-layer homology domain